MKDKFMVSIVLLIIFFSSHVFAKTEGIKKVKEEFFEIKNDDFRGNGVGISNFTQNGDIRSIVYDCGILRFNLNNSFNNLEVGAISLDEWSVGYKVGDGGSYYYMYIDVDHDGGARRWFNDPIRYWDDWEYSYDSYIYYYQHIFNNNESIKEYRGKSRYDISEEELEYDYKNFRIDEEGNILLHVNNKNSNNNSGQDTRDYHYFIARIDGYLGKVLIDDEIDNLIDYDFGDNKKAYIIYEDNGTIYHSYFNITYNNLRYSEEIDINGSRIYTNDGSRIRSNEIDYLYVMETENYNVVKVKNKVYLHNLSTNKYEDTGLSVSNLSNISAEYLNSKMYIIANDNNLYSYDVNAKTGEYILKDDTSNISFTNQKRNNELFLKRGNKISILYTDTNEFKEVYTDNDNVKLLVSNDKILGFKSKRHDEYYLMEFSDTNTTPTISVDQKDIVMNENRRVSITGYSSDDGDDITIEATLDGIRKTTTIDGSGKWSLFWNASDLSEGDHTDIEVKAYDKYNWSTDGLIERTDTYTGTITIKHPFKVEKLIEGNEIESLKHRGGVELTKGNFFKKLSSENKWIIYNLASGEIKDEGVLIEDVKNLSMKVINSNNILFYNNDYLYKYNIKEKTYSKRINHSGYTQRMLIKDNGDVVFIKESNNRVYVQIVSGESVYNRSFYMNSSYTDLLSADVFKGNKILFLYEFREDRRDDRVYLCHRILDESNNLKYVETSTDSQYKDKVEDFKYYRDKYDIDIEDGITFDGKKLIPIVDDEDDEFVRYYIYNAKNGTINYKGRDYGDDIDHNNTFYHPNNFFMYSQEWDSGSDSDDRNITTLYKVSGYSFNTIKHEMNYSKYDFEKVGADGHMVATSLENGSYYHQKERTIDLIKNNSNGYINAVSLPKEFHKRAWWNINDVYWYFTEQSPKIHFYEAPSAKKYIMVGSKYLGDEENQEDTRRETIIKEYVYGNDSPEINISNKDEDRILGIGKILRLEGTVIDKNHNPIEVSATIEGITKSFIVNPGDNNWYLEWETNNLSETIYKDIKVTANDNIGFDDGDGREGKDFDIYTGEIMVDLTPPLKPEITLSNYNWTKDDVKVDISYSEDNFSGLKSVEYKIDDGEWLSYIPSFMITESKLTKIISKATDNALNENIDIKYVKIDRDKPIYESVYINALYNENNIYYTNNKAPFDIIINSKDTLSGLKNISLKLKNEDLEDITYHNFSENLTNFYKEKSLEDITVTNFLEENSEDGIYQSKFNLKGNKELKYNILVKLIDKVDNTLDYVLTDKSVMIDKTKPTVLEPTVIGRQIKKVTLRGEDTLSGIKEIKYDLGNGFKTYNTPLEFNIDDYDGYINIDIKVTDNVLNESEVVTKKVILNRFPTFELLNIINEEYTVNDKLNFKVKVNDRDLDNNTKLVLEKKEGTEFKEVKVIDNLVNNSIYNLSLDDNDWKALDYSKENIFRFYLTDEIEKTYSSEFKVTKINEEPKLNIIKPKNNQFMLSGYLDFKYFIEDNDTDEFGDINFKIYTDTENIANNGILFSDSIENGEHSLISNVYMPEGTHKIYFEASDSEKTNKIVREIKISKEVDFNNNEKYDSDFYVAKFDTLKSKIYYRRLKNKLKENIYLLNILGENADKNESYLNEVMNDVKNLTNKERYVAKRGYTKDEFNKEKIQTFFEENLNINDDVGNVIKVNESIILNNLIFTDYEEDYVKDQRGEKRRFAIYHVPKIYDNSVEEILNNGKFNEVSKVWNDDSYILEPNFTKFDGKDIKKDNGTYELKVEKPGKYIVNILEDDKVSNSKGIDYSKSNDDINYIFYAHRRPVVELTYVDKGNRTIDIVKSAYDLDFKSRNDKGIKEEKLEYRLLNNQEEIIKDWGILEKTKDIKLSEKHTTEIRYSVMDYGALLEKENDLELKNSKTLKFEIVKKPPIADFEYVLNNKKIRYAIKGNVGNEYVYFRNKTKYNDILAEGTRTHFYKKNQMKFNSDIIFKDLNEIENKLTVMNRYGIEDSIKKSLNVEKLNLINKTKNNYHSKKGFKKGELGTFDFLQLNQNIKADDIEVKLEVFDNEYILDNLKRDIKIKADEKFKYTLKIYSKRDKTLLFKKTYEAKAYNPIDIYDVEITEVYDQAYNLKNTLPEGKEQDIWYGAAFEFKFKTKGIEDSAKVKIIPEFKIKNENVEILTKKNIELESIPIIYKESHIGNPKIINIRINDNKGEGIYFIPFDSKVYKDKFIKKGKLEIIMNFYYKNKIYSTNSMIYYKISKKYSSLFKEYIK